MACGWDLAHSQRNLRWGGEAVDAAAAVAAVEAAGVTLTTGPQTRCGTPMSATVTATYPTLTGAGGAGSRGLGAAWR